MIDEGQVPHPVFCGMKGQVPCPTFGVKRNYYRAVAVFIYDG